MGRGSIGILEPRYPRTIPMRVEPWLLGSD